MKSRRVIIVGAVAALIALCGVVILWPERAPSFEDVRAQFTPSDAFLLDRNGEVIDAVRIDMKVRRYEWQPLSAVSPAFVSAVIRGEDARFYEHDGIDWRSVLGAMRDRYLRGKQRGASTITMQVASLLRDTPRLRSGLQAWTHKRNQIRMARALEASWTKEQILEAYLNLLPYRGELQGIAAASQVLAGKVPSGLSLSESLVIAALLPQPGASPERVAARACNRARAANIAIDCGEIKLAAMTLLSNGVERSAAPQLAPQLAHTLLRSPGQRVKTTIDARLQRTARAVLEQQLGRLADENVRDGAILVVDNESADVLAYVGSAGPRSSARYVDGVRALRQAGSTLKPFLYALAMERRYLNAASLVKDLPVHLDTATGAYIPQDYDKDYKGLVSVRTALGNSLNIPAVRTLVLVGVEPFRDRLYELGYEHITESGDYYGYSLALGSAEVSLWEQARAYRTLARGGRSSPLHVLPGGHRAEERALLPADVSFIVADMMSDPAARTLTFGVDNHLNTAFWSAVKTGTSKDMRDNWCVGFSSRYTVAVWVGNFEGDSMHDVSGVTGAAPVWREVMSRLHRDVPSIAPTPPADVVAVSTRFANNLEAPRREWFTRDQQSTPQATVALAAPIPRIASPANGMVIAVDPDIPTAYQKLPISTEGATRSMRLKLNGAELARADRVTLWTPEAGSYALELGDERGKVLDRVVFTVR
ncbi:penicillin-binding protein 1C [Steroidobacter sp. S1-65]|uniref:peptidoglycan glycosyltransferase n=1 Tax=Steroidobacter gossypii TaxID=2805490 RepID=A0ABS1WUW1_9GAMM|nr:penicillin-binding protein 1C [Steroidobacter gossypii]MBM0104770.1 penicillin-binding protein 1C [Steroidobacter gossypii]